MSHTFPDQATTLPMQAFGFFLIGRWNLHEAPYLPLAPCMRHQGTQQCVGIDSIGFDAPCAAINL
jgi:hypothetical protein